MTDLIEKLKQADGVGRPRIDWGKWRAQNPQPKRKWVRSKCEDCGARTLSEAAEKCRPHQLPCGEYVCAVDPDHQPEKTFGYIYRYSPEWMERDGLYWATMAFDEGYSNKLPDASKPALLEALSAKEKG